MGYEFFFSYTRANNDPYLKQFFDDLSQQIRDLRGLPKDAAVGFLDQREIELGEDWDNTIVEALQNSKVVIAATSPAYLKSDYCGREWQLFHQRLQAATSPGQALPPLIKPIIWVPFKASEVPPKFAEGQFTFGDPHEIHNTKGFKYVLQQFQEFKTQYVDLIHILGEEIVNAADAHTVPPLAIIPRLREVVSIFSTVSGPRGEVVPIVPNASGPKHVRFVYLAADPRQFAPARQVDSYLDCGGADWKPFYPSNKTRIHRFVQNVVADDELDFTSDELMFSPNLIAEISAAWQRRQIVVLIIDGWSVHWSLQYRTVLTELDGRLDYHWCVLFPWNDQDSESIAKRELIMGAVSQTFDRHANLARNALFYRDHIKSAEELKTVLREVLTRLKEEIKKRAPVDMPVPPGPSKFTVIGPSAVG
jgi:FxsC-like protein